MKTLFAFFLLAQAAFAAVGSWNGVAFTAWNGVAQTSWNGTSISCAAGGGTPAFARAANATAADGVSSRTITVTINIGDTVVVGTGWEDADRTVTVTDDGTSGGNTYTALTKSNTAGQIYGQMFRAVNVSKSATTITISYGASTAFVKAACVIGTGITALDEEATPHTGTDGAVPQSTGNITADNNVVLLVCMTMNYVGATVVHQTSWTESYEGTGFEAQYFVTSSTGTYHGEGVFSAGGSHIVQMSAYK